MLIDETLLHVDPDAHSEGTVIDEYCEDESSLAIVLRLRTDTAIEEVSDLRELIVLWALGT